MNKPTFLEELERRVLVCDGAMGTMLYARGVFLNRSFDELNLTQPDLVTDVHHAYVRAGADVIETNTFGANRIKLVDVRPGGSDGGNQHRGGQAGAAGGPRSGVRRRRDRAARRAYRAVGKTGIDEAERTSASRRRRSSKAASTCSCSRLSAI